MTDNKVVAFRHKGKIDDPLTEILRSRARRRWRPNSRPYWARTPISSCWTAASALFGTVMIRSTQSSQGSGRWRWKNSRRGIAGRRLPRSASAIRRRSCRNGRAARKASTVERLVDKETTGHFAPEVEFSGRD